MKIKILAILCLSLLVVFSGCSGGDDESLKVAKGFWEAMEDKDLEKAKTFVTKESAKTLQINNDEEDVDKKVDIAFGEITKEDGKTIIETMIQTNEDGKDLEIPLKTILVKEDGDWKVDADQTMMSLFGGAMGAMMEVMKEGMEEMGKAMADEMKAGMEEMEKELSDIDKDE